MAKMFLTLLSLLNLISVCGLQAQPPDRPGDEVYISTPSVWDLSIKKDGSGSIGFGASLGNYGEFASGTFVLDDLYQKLKAVAAPDAESSSRTHIHVSFPTLRDKNGFPAGFYLGNGQFAISLFEAALRKVTDDKARDRLAELAKTHPFVSSGEHYTFPQRP